MQLGDQLGQQINPEEAEILGRQDLLLQKIESRLRTVLFENSDQRNKARLNGCQGLHAGDWLLVIPNENLGLRLEKENFRMCLRYWLGMDIYSKDHKKECNQCGQPSDIHGDHAVSCANSGDRISRHNNLCDSVASALRAASIRNVQEQRHLFANNNARPGDILADNWMRGRAVAFDVTVVSPIVPSNLKGSSKIDGTGFSAAKGETAKQTKYQDQCNEMGFDLIPLVMETLGGWGPMAVAALDTIARRLADMKGRNRSEEKLHLYQRLGVTLWRANSNMWLKRLRDN